MIHLPSRELRLTPEARVECFAAIKQLTLPECVLGSWTDIENQNQPLFRILRYTRGRIWGNLEHHGDNALQVWSFKTGAALTYFAFTYNQDKPKCVTIAALDQVMEPGPINLSELFWSSLVRDEELQNLLDNLDEVNETDTPLHRDILRLGAGNVYFGLAAQHSFEYGVQFN